MKNITLTLNEFINFQALAKKANELYNYTIQTINGVIEYIITADTNFLNKLNY